MPHIDPPEFENIDSQDKSSLKVSFYNREHFQAPRGIHYHPEFEIVYINGGTGRRLIKNKYTQYTDGDLLLIGPNVIHHGIDDSVRSGFDQVVVQFPSDMLSNRIGAIIELRSVREMLQRSSGVVVFDNEEKHDLGEQLMALLGESPELRIFSLIRILKDMSMRTYAVQFPEEDRTITEYNRVRLTLLMNYLKENLAKDIQLAEVAAHLRLTKTSLSRFVKQNTGKPFSLLLNEFRIHYACDLLHNEELNITEVALSAGFNSLSNFNDYFRRIMSMSPREFRQLIQD